MIKDLRPYLNSGGNNNYSLSFLEGKDNYSVIKCQLDNIDNSRTTDSYVNWDVFRDLIRQPGIWTNQHSYNIEQLGPWYDPLCVDENCFTDTRLNSYYNPVTGEYVIRPEGDNEPFLTPISLVDISPFDDVRPFLTSSSIDSEYLLGDVSFIAKAYVPTFKNYDNQLSIIISIRADRGDNCLDPCFFSDATKVFEVIINLDDTSERHVYCDLRDSYHAEIDTLVDIHLQRVILQQSESFRLGLDLYKNPYYFSEFIQNDVQYSALPQIKEVKIEDKIIRYFEYENEIYIWKEGNVYDESYLLTVDIGIINFIGDKIRWIETDISVDYFGRFQSNIRIPNTIRVFRFHHIYINKKALVGLYYTKGNELFNTRYKYFRDFILEDQEIPVDELCFTLLLLLNTNYEDLPNEFSRDYHQNVRLKQIIERHIDSLISFINPQTGSLPKYINSIINPADLYDDAKYKIIKASCFDNRLMATNTCVTFDDDYIVNDRFICKPNCYFDPIEIFINTREVDNLGMCYFWLLIINYQKVYKSDKYLKVGERIREYLESVLDPKYLLIPQSDNQVFVFRVNLIYLIAYMQWIELTGYSRGYKICDIIYRKLRDNLFNLDTKLFEHQSIEQFFTGYIFSIIEKRQDQIYAYESFIKKTLEFKTNSFFELYDDEELLQADDIDLYISSSDFSKLGGNALDIKPITKKIIFELSNNNNIKASLSFEDDSLISKIDNKSLDFMLVNNWRDLYAYQIRKTENTALMKNITLFGEDYFSKEALDRGEMHRLYESLSEELSLKYDLDIKNKELCELYDIDINHKESMEDYRKRLIATITNKGITKPNIEAYISLYNLLPEIKETQIIGTHSDNTIFNPIPFESFLQGDRKYISQYEINIYEGALSNKFIDKVRDHTPIARRPIVNEFIVGKDKDYKEGRMVGLEAVSNFVPVTIEPVCCEIDYYPSECRSRGTIYKLTYLEPVRNVYTIYENDGDLVALYSSLIGYRPLQVINPLENPEQYIFIKR